MIDSNADPKGKAPIRGGSHTGNGYRVEPTLESLPPEIIELIAFYCASTVIVPDSTSNARDFASREREAVSAALPSDLRSLILTSSRMYRLLNSTSNCRLYARIFRSKFDVSAIVRRFGPHAASPANLTRELQRRCIILKRIKRSVMLRDYDLQGPNGAGRLRQEENLWLAFMMMMENDGLNILQLQWAQIHDYLRLQHSQDMLQSAFKPELPPNTPDRALALWLNYLLCDPVKLLEESQDESDEKLFVLRPYVFAAHKFDAFYAPWLQRRLPLQDSSSLETDLNGNSGMLAFRSEDFNLPARTLEYCGRMITIRPPNATQAACLSFFMKVERDPAVTGIPEIFDPMDIQGTMLGRRTSPTGDEQSSSRNAVSLESRDHDRDMNRLLACLSPLRSRGLPLSNHLGQMEGSWEGRFTYFDFDSYRDMLGGKLRSLYEGPFGEQPQVWKIREHIVRLRPGETVGGTGDSLNAGFYSETDIEPSDRESISAGEAMKLFDRTSTEPRCGRALSAKDVGGLPPADMHLYPSFDEADTNGTAMDLDVGVGDENRYEILLSGTGHSAWGQFLLRGRIRAWDGLVIMAKEYRPDGRGRWLYRGYVVAGDKLVGRWRDTFTPEGIAGYEGCFLLCRRGH